MKHSTYPNSVRYAEYGIFEIQSESEGYMLKIGSFSGNAGDGLSYHNNCMFTTRDRDNDKSRVNCTRSYTGAWWYKNCMFSNLNGRYPAERQGGFNYIGWLFGYYGGIIFSELKLKYSSL